MTQDFNGSVHGDVAGRDVVHGAPSSVHGINVNGSASFNQVIETAEPSSARPESQLQAEFYRNAGIWCPRGARDMFEDLMTHHAFTARELTIAWRASSLRWGIDSGRLEIVTPMIEAIFGWSVFVVMLISFLFVALPYALSGSWTTGLETFLTVGAMYVGSAWMANRFLLWPRRIAMRVRKALARRSGSAQP